MKESSNKEVHVKVSESEDAAHLMLLEAIYKVDILNDASVEDLLSVLELADKYDVKFVFKKSKYVLLTRVTTVDVCKKVMYVIKEKHDYCDVEDLAASTQVTMGEKFTPLELHWQTDRFTSQSLPFVQYLLSSSELRTRCENTVFQALMFWMEVNNVDPESLEKDSGLLKSVRFENLTIDYLYNVVRVHPIASKMPGFQDLMLQGMTYHALNSSAELKQRLQSEVTPRERKLLPASTPQYTWKISKTQLFTHNSTPILSEEFWVCGYKAKMEIVFYSGSVSNKNYGIQVGLCLLGLTSKSYIPINFTINGSRGNVTLYENNNVCRVNVNINKTNSSDPVEISIVINQPTNV